MTKWIAVTRATAGSAGSRHAIRDFYEPFGRELLDLGAQFLVRDLICQRVQGGEYRDLTGIVSAPARILPTMLEEPKQYGVGHDEHFRKVELALRGIAIVDIDIALRGGVVGDNGMLVAMLIGQNLVKSVAG
jgi:hypothetical protein